MSTPDEDAVSPREELGALIRQELENAYRSGLASFTSAGNAILGYPAEAAAVAVIMAAVDACIAGEAAALAARDDDDAGSGADSEERD